MPVAALAFLEARLPTATRLVYDNYNALVVGFGPSDRASQAILSIALYPKYVRIFFLRGVDLPDPQGLLEGSGSQVRSVKLQPITLIETPEVRSLIDFAVAGCLRATARALSSSSRFRPSRGQEGLGSNGLASSDAYRSRAPQNLRPAVASRAAEPLPGRPPRRRRGPAGNDPCPAFGSSSCPTGDSRPG